MHFLATIVVVVAIPVVIFGLFGALCLGVDWVIGLARKVKGHR